ncbi:mechanosensitive ion channel [Ramlibacter sp. G-1-2-2]|uniref:Mechanosensitive ion channel n=1 Tax=Ramlibacter agri TaxID=2728837 RepID=A0A848GZ28_9BURK|nr:mechanosensitive ion channel domain-containing protein [Ramlibacter agri]NML43956.1 mechanosensitive ion channel [Ramlibacter agri]
MTCRAARLLAGLLIALFLLPAMAPAQILPPASTASAPERPRDPYGRETPRRALASFVAALRMGNPAVAVRYLQVPAAQRANAEDLAHDLGDLMDRYFLAPLTTISDAPEGTLNDGLPVDRERVGPLRIAGEDQYIELVRVQDPVAGQVWVVSPQTVARIPQWYAAMGSTWAERVLPAAFSRYDVFGVTLAHAVVWLLSLVLPLMIVPLLLEAAFRLLRRLVRKPNFSEFLAAWHADTRWPAVAVVTLLLHLEALPAFGQSFAFRVAYTRFILVLLMVALAWALLRIGMLVFRRTESQLLVKGRTGPRSVMLLGERLYKVLICFIAVVAVLRVAGVDISTALAGLGIVGIAVALGAQKTVENLLGGILLLGDEAIAVGDFCSVGGRTGWVEDITLRSVRIRTLEQTLLSIPAGVLAQGNIENFSSRKRCLAQNTLRIAYGASSEQVRAITAALGELLAQNPRVDPSGARVRLVDMGWRGFELELFAWFRTGDWGEFLALRQEVLLQAAAIVERHGAVFAASPVDVVPQLP